MHPLRSLLYQTTARCTSRGYFVKKKLLLLGCRHLDADEAVALGAGLVAANHSTTFRLRKFGVADGAMHPITFQARPGPSLRLQPHLSCRRRAIEMHGQDVDAVETALFDAHYSHWICYLKTEVHASV